MNLPYAVAFRCAAMFRILSYASSILLPVLRYTSIIPSVLIFSSILTRGIEQSIVQMGIVITSFLDELVSVKSIQQLKNLFANSTNFQSYEAFMRKFLLNAFWKTQDIFEVFREDKKDDILKINNILLVLFIIIDMVIFSFLVYFIYSYVAVLNSFLNFIGILPSKFISDDEALYQNIIQLQEYY